MRLGSTFVGTSKIETSVAGEDINSYKVPLYKFSFMNDEDCTVSINGSEPLFLRAGMGFSTDEVDSIITSFVILEDGIGYNWIGGA